MQSFIQWGGLTPEQQQAKRDSDWQAAMEYRAALNEAARQSSAATIAVSGSRGPVPTWETTGNTVYLYPEVDFVSTEADWQYPLVKDGSNYYFDSIVDINQFYYQVWYRTFLAWPKPDNPNSGGYSVGVPSDLTGSFKEKRFYLRESGRLVTVLQELTLVTPQSTLPLANQGDAPDGQVGWATVWLDIDLNDIPDPINPGQNPAPYGDIDTLRLVRTN